MLAAIHQIAEDKRVAFRARLKHFQRLGVPSGVNTGTGKRAAYGLDQLLQLSLAMQMLELGLSPERITVLLQNWIRQRDFIFEVASDARDRRAFLLLFPAALNSLRGSEGIKAQVPAAFAAVDEEGMKAVLQTKFEQPLGVIDLTGMVYSLFEKLRELGCDGHLSDALRQLAAEFMNAKHSQA